MHRAQAPNEPKHRNVKDVHHIPQGLTPAQYCRDFVTERIRPASAVAHLTQTKGQSLPCHELSSAASCDMIHRETSTWYFVFRTEYFDEVLAVHQ